MWHTVSEELEDYPERLRVARVLIENGFSVRRGRIFCNDIEIPPIRIARVANVDRRTVTQTMKAIHGNSTTCVIFEHLRNAGHSLKDVAKHLNMGVVEITPIDAKTPGILAKSASLLAESNISIRQAIVDDPELSPEPKLTLLVEQKIPGDLFPRFLNITGVGKVTIY